MNTAQQEAAHLDAEGYRRVTLETMAEELVAMGYLMPRNDDRCYAASTWVTGERAGQSSPHCSLGAPVEADTGLRAWNVNARRDENFKAMQEWRGSTYAIVHMHGTSYIATI